MPDVVPFLTYEDGIAALEWLAEVFGFTETARFLAGHYRLDAVRAHLFEMAGDHLSAIAHYRAAARRTTSIPERDYLTTQAARVSAEASPA